MAPIKAGDADIVLGSRFPEGERAAAGQALVEIHREPILMTIENWVLGSDIADITTVIAPIAAGFSKKLRFSLNSDKFAFD